MDIMFSLLPNGALDGELDMFFDLRGDCLRGPERGAFSSVLEREAAFFSGRSGEVRFAFVEGIGAESKELTGS